MNKARAFRRVIPISASLFALLISAQGAFAQTNTADGPQSTRTPDDKWGVSLSVENDLFTPTNSDQHYTNGVRIAFISPEDAAPASFLNVAKKVPFFAIRRPYSHQLFAGSNHVHPR